MTSTALHPIPDFAATRDLCAWAAEEIRRCAEEVEEQHRSAVADCGELCTDAAIVLEALGSMLSRPYAPARAVGVRRMIEAGLAACIECAAETEEHPDDLFESPACCEAAAKAADHLRHLLTSFVDDDVAARSGAT